MPVGQDEQSNGWRRISGVSPRNGLGTGPFSMCRVLVRGSLIFARVDVNTSRLDANGAAHVRDKAAGAESMHVTNPSSRIALP